MVLIISKLDNIFSLWIQMWKTLTSTSYCQLCFHTQTKNIYFSQTTSPGPTPVNALLFWSAHTLLPVSWCFRWRQRGSDCEAGGGSVCWVYELADVLLVWMSWKHTHVHTHTWSDNSSAGETITGNGGTVFFYIFFPLPSPLPSLWLREDER